MIFEDFKIIDSTQEYLREYWEGPSNRFVRYWTYFREGLGLLNEGKYILGLLGLGIFKSDIIFTWQILLSGIIIGVPILCLAGRWNLFHANKARQFITGQHGTLTRFQSHNMQVMQTEVMGAIAIKLGINIEEIKNKLGIK